MLEWKIWYSDGSTFSNEDGSPDEAIALDVQYIVMADDMVGKYIISGMDYYYYEHDRWFGCDLFGFFDYIVRTKKVKFGRSMKNTEFKQLGKKVISDSDFLAKSGWHPHERKLNK